METHSTASCPGQPRQAGTTKDDGVAVASAGPYANRLHRTPDRQPRQHLIAQFSAGWALFLTPKTNSVKALKVKPSTETRLID